MDIKINAEVKEIAAKLAHESDELQADFFNIFFKELSHACETRYKKEMQMTYILNKLKKETLEDMFFIGDSINDEGRA